MTGASAPLRPVVASSIGQRMVRETLRDGFIKDKGTMNNKRPGRGA
jgi:hypothetical protein